MWDLPRPGLEPVSPALAGRFSTTAPPGKPGRWILNHCTTREVPRSHHLFGLYIHDFSHNHLSQAGGGQHFLMASNSPALVPPSFPLESVHQKVDEGEWFFPALLKSDWQTKIVYISGIQHNVLISIYTVKWLPKLANICIISHSYLFLCVW